MSGKTVTMYKVEASHKPFDAFVVEYPSIAGRALDEATSGEFENELVNPGDSVTFTITRVLMSPEEVAESEEALEFEGW